MLANTLVFGVTFIAVRVHALRAGAEASIAIGPAALAPPALPLEADRLWRLLLLITFGTAVASFVYKISWIRVLSLVLGRCDRSCGPAGRPLAQRG